MENIQNNSSIKIQISKDDDYTFNRLKALQTLFMKEYNIKKLCKS